jgi:hypothetical protein
MTEAHKRNFDAIRKNSQFVRRKKREADGSVDE